MLITRSAGYHCRREAQIQKALNETLSKMDTRNIKWFDETGKITSDKNAFMAKLKSGNMSKEQIDTFYDANKNIGPLSAPAAGKPSVTPPAAPGAKPGETPAPGVDQSKVDAALQNNHFTDAEAAAARDATTGKSAAATALSNHIAAIKKSKDLKDNEKEAAISQLLKEFDDADLGANQGLDQRQAILNEAQQNLSQAGVSAPNLGNYYTGGAAPAPAAGPTRGGPVPPKKIPTSPKPPPIIGLDSVTPKDSDDGQWHWNGADWVPK